MASTKLQEMCVCMPLRTMRLCKFLEYSLTACYRSGYQKKLKKNTKQRNVCSCDWHK